MKYKELETELNHPKSWNRAMEMVRLIVKGGDHEQFVKRREALIDGGVWYIDPDGSVESLGQKEEERQGCDVAIIKTDPVNEDFYADTYYFCKDDKHTYFGADYFYHK